METLEQSMRTMPVGLTRSQWEAICALKAPEEVAISTIEASRSTEVYLSRAQFDAEIRDIFRAKPVVATLSAYLPEPNTVLAQDSYGIPLLVTRDRSGVARCFLNACRHRGSKLVEGREPVKVGRLSCPYHAWTYNMDGKLMGVPRQETFPSVKESLHNPQNLR